MLVTDGQTDQGMDGQKERQADGWTDRERDGRMDKNDFIARCPTKVDNFTWQFPSKDNSNTSNNNSFLSLVLTLNNFIFNCKNCIKIKGCVMGITWELLYDNVFMHHFERKYVYLFLRGFSLTYLRFIDDIFFIWTGSNEKLKGCSIITSR